MSYRTMQSKIRFSTKWTLLALVGAALLAVCISHGSAAALNQIPDPDPKPGSYGLEATKTKAPPTKGATITTPGNGASFNSSPITVSGICPTGLLVQIHNNGVMVGSVMCERGSFSIQVSLFVGANELSALVYDEVDQAGPKSNTMTVQYTNTNFSAFGELVTLTSSYGRRSAGAGSLLSWPLQLSGGTGPYAFSIDWGDGSDAQLKSQSLAGLITINHVYKKAGIYRVNIKVTDTNGVSAFLQVVAVSNGKVDSATAAATDDEPDATVTTKILWIPMVISLMLLLPTYWLGRRSQLVSIRNKMLKERDAYGPK